MKTTHLIQVVSAEDQVDQDVWSLSKLALTEKVVQFKIFRRLQKPRQSKEK